jgi:hypothetical protein
VRGAGLGLVEQKTASAAAKLFADCNNEVTSGKPEAAAVFASRILLATNVARLNKTRRRTSIADLSG